MHDCHASSWSPATSPAKLSPEASRLAGERLRTVAWGAMSIARTIGVEGAGLVRPALDPGGGGPALASGDAELVDAMAGAAR